MHVIQIIGTISHLVAIATSDTLKYKSLDKGSDAHLVIKFGTKAADDLKCIGLIMKPLEVSGDGPRIFYVNCVNVVLCGYRGNPYKPSCVAEYEQDIPGFYECLSKAATQGALTACSHKKIRCSEKCKDIYFDLWEARDLEIAVFNHTQGQGEMHRVEVGNDT